MDSTEIEFNEGPEQNLVEENLQEEVEQQSDNESMDDGMTSDDEYETIDVTQNPLYHVLSAFFEDDDGNNVVDKLNLLSENIKLQTECINKTNESLLNLLDSFSKMTLRSNRTKRVKK